MREISADHAGIGDGVIGFADLRVQQKLNIEHRVRRQDDEVCQFSRLDAAQLRLLLQRGGIVHRRRLQRRAGWQPGLDEHFQLLQQRETGRHVRFG